MTDLRFQRKHDAIKDAALVRDQRFLATLLDQFEHTGAGEETFSPYRSLPLSSVQAQAVFRFQMSGCYAVALSGIDPTAWPDAQQAIDQFIRGGLNALRN